MRKNDMHDKLQQNIFSRRAFTFLTSTVFLFFFVVVVRPFCLDYVDELWRESKKDPVYGLPFAVEAPPAGEGWFLRRSQLRYLLIEEIRLGAMRDLINHDNDKAMREYFDMLEEFNASAQNCFCEKTDYRAAKTDVEPFRERIEAFAAMEVEASGWDR